MASHRLEVAPLVSGVRGALHQSFSSEEEARRIFEEASQKGNTRIVGGNLQVTTSTPLTSPLASPSQMRATHSSPSPSQTSPPAMNSNSNLHSCSEHISSPVGSPRVITRANSDASQHLTGVGQLHFPAFPSATVPPPSGVSSPPSDGEMFTSPSSGVSWTAPLNPPGESLPQQMQAGYTLPGSPSTPVSHVYRESTQSPGRSAHSISRSSSESQHIIGGTRVYPDESPGPTSSIPCLSRIPYPSPHVLAQSPSGVASYPSECGFTSPSCIGMENRTSSHLLSPLNSPRLVSAQQCLLCESDWTSTKIPSSSAAYSKRPPQTIPFDAVPRDHGPNTDMQPVVIMTPMYPLDNHQQQFICPHCYCTSIQVTGSAMLYGFTQPTHVSNIARDPSYDPRSPITKQSSVPAPAK